MDKEIKRKIEILSRITVARGATHNEQNIAQEKIKLLRKQLGSRPKVKGKINYNEAVRPTEVKVYSPYYGQDFKPTNVYDHRETDRKFWKDYEYERDKNWLERKMRDILNKHKDKTCP